MNQLKEMLAVGREQAVGHLFSMAWGAPGLTDMPVEERAKMSNQLRHLATLIEDSPQVVAGIVCIAGEKVSIAETEGISSCVMISGTAPLIAAAHLVLEEHGKTALDECVPGLIREAVSSFLDANGAEAATVQ